MNDVAAQLSNSPDQAAFLAYMEEYLDADQAVASAVGERKDLRKRIKGDGFNLAQFDRVRKEAEKSGSIREAEDREYRRYMAWLGKPLGFQERMFEDEEDAPPAPPASAREVSPIQLGRVQIDGKQAHAAGRDREANPWTPGTFLYQVWDQSWTEAEDATVPPPAAPPNLTPSGKRRGRPPGSKNRRRAA